MTFEILSTPVNSPASLIFQQCLAEVDPENRSLNSAMNEVGGYFLDRADASPISKELWNKVLVKTNNEKTVPQINEEHDPLLSQLPLTLRSHLRNKNIKWKSFKDVKHYKVVHDFSKKGGCFTVFGMVEEKGFGSIAEGLNTQHHNYTEFYSTGKNTQLRFSK